MERETWMHYLVVVEQGEGGYGTYVPDLLGCIAAAESREQVLALIQDAIAFHLEGLCERGESVPVPSSTAQLVEIGAA